MVAAQLGVAKRERGFSETERLEALLLLVAGGGDRIEDIRILAEDQGLGRLLEREIPFPDALLAFLGAPSMTRRYGSSGRRARSPGCRPRARRWGAVRSQS